MSKANEFYSPDYQQAHKHHEELLKKAAQNRLALQAMANPSRKFALSRGWESLRRWLSDRRSSKMVRTASQSSGSRT